TLKIFPARFIDKYVFFRYSNLPSSFQLSFQRLIDTADSCIEKRPHFISPFPCKLLILKRFKKFYNIIIKLFQNIYKIQEIFQINLCCIIDTINIKKNPYFKKYAF